MASFAPAPPPVLVNIPHGHPVFSIDVECVATGTQHNARSIAQVALGMPLSACDVLLLPHAVDEWGRLLFNCYIKQDVPIVSHLTQLTGITKEILDQYGMPLGKHPRLRVDSLLTALSRGAGHPAVLPDARSHPCGAEHHERCAMAATCARCGLSLVDRPERSVSCVERSARHIHQLLARSLC